MLYFYKKIIILLLLFLPFISLAENNQNINLAELLLNSTNIINQQNINYTNYQAKPVALIYWTWWCSICKQQLQNLNSLQQKNPNKQFYVIGISVDDPQKNYKKTLKIAKSLQFDNFYLNQQKSTYQPETIPTTFIFNSQHQQIATIEGLLDEKELAKIIFSQ
jgi:peroxiredoxin